MGVRYEGGGQPLPTNFSDSLTTGIATSYGLGDSWASVGPVGFNVEGAGAQISRGAPGCDIRASAALQSIVRPLQHFTPWTLVAGVRSNQYAEIQFTSNNSAQGTAVLVAGIYVLGAVQGSDWRAYYLTQGIQTANPADNRWQISRHDTPSGGFTTIAAGANGSLLAGQTAGISVDVQPTQNVIRTWVNNVLVDSTIDNNANRPLFGNCGIGRTVWVSGAVPGTKVAIFQNFFGRAGTR